jgi:hypothetical protein
MAIWDDIARVGAAVVTGGASEVALALAQKEAEKRRREQQEQQQKAAAAQGAAASAGGRDDDGTRTQVNTCCRYAIEPPFLLDTQNGRIWRYDDTKKQFLIVSKESTTLEKSWESLLFAKLTADVVDGLNEVTKTSSRAEHLRVANLVDSHIKVMDEHLKQLKS